METVLDDRTLTISSTNTPDGRPGEAGDDMSLPNGPQGQKNIKEKRYSE